METKNLQNVTNNFRLIVFWFLENNLVELVVKAREYKKKVNIRINNYNGVAEN